MWTQYTVEQALAQQERMLAETTTEWATCAFQPEGSKANYAAECSMRLVPGNWDQAGSHWIALPVVRVRTSGSQPAEPVFLRNGGSDASNLTWAHRIDCSKTMMW